jgi:hypothetical protein
MAEYGQLPRVTPRNFPGYLTSTSTRAHVSVTVTAKASGTSIRYGATNKIAVTVAPTSPALS